MKPDRPHVDERQSVYVDERNETARRLSVTSWPRNEPFRGISNRRWCARRNAESLRDIEHQPVGLRSWFASASVIAGQLALGTASSTNAADDLR